MQVKKLEDEVVKEQLQDAEDFGAYHLGSVQHGPAPFIVVKEFPAWIDRGKSAFPTGLDQSTYNRINSSHPSLQKSKLNQFSHNGDLVKTISEQLDENVGKELVQSQNAQKLINHLGLMNYKQPGRREFETMCNSFLSYPIFFSYLVEIEKLAEDIENEIKCEAGREQDPPGEEGKPPSGSRRGSMAPSEITIKVSSSIIHMETFTLLLRISFHHAEQVEPFRQFVFQR